MKGYLPLQVCRSMAGYYIGRIHQDDTVMPGFQEPGSRESGYYTTREEAEKDLKSGNFEVRDTQENIMAYNCGVFPDIRNSNIKAVEVLLSQL